MKFHLLQSHELGPLVHGLRALEADIRYPIADGADFFTIDHGEDYHRFFSGLGDAWFLVAEHQGEVVGSVAGVLSEGRATGRRVPTGYLADLKLAPAWRGTGLARQMAVEILRLLATRRRFRQWHIGYFAAMRGETGDVSRTFRGLHPGRLLSPQGRLTLWFADPSALASLPDDGPATPADGWLELAPTDEAVVRTAGRKDLRIGSTGEPWPLHHLAAGPRAWTPTWGAWLRRTAADLPPDSVACFGLDDRLGAHAAWLESHGIHPGATCTVFTLHRPGALRGVRQIHLPTSSI